MIDILAVCQEQIRRGREGSKTILDYVRGIILVPSKGNEVSGDFLR